MSSDLLKGVLSVGESKNTDPTKVKKADTADASKSTSEYLVFVEKTLKKDTFDGKKRKTLNTKLPDNPFVKVGSGGVSSIGTINTNTADLSGATSLQDFLRKMAAWHIQYVEGRALSTDQRDPAHRGGFGSKFGITSGAMNGGDPANLTESQAINIYVNNFFMPVARQLGFTDWNTMTAKDKQMLFVLCSFEKHNPANSRILRNKVKAGQVTDPFAALSEYKNFLMNTGQSHYYAGWTAMLGKINGAMQSLGSTSNNQRKLLA